MPKGTPASAPDVVGPVSILNQPVVGPRENRRRRDRPYGHVQYVLDLALQPGKPIDHPTAQSLQKTMDKKQIEAGSDFVHLVAALLHALSARRFKWIDHWEAGSAGWLPIPTHKDGASGVESVGQLEETIASGSWAPGEKADSFSARLTDHAGGRVDLVVRAHPHLFHHSLTIDLWGKWTKSSADELIGSVASRVPVKEAKMTKYAYSTDST